MSVIAGKVEKLGGVELVVQPAGIGAAVLVEHAGDRAPLRGLAFRLVAVGGLGDGFGAGLPLASGHRRDSAHGGVDRAGQRHQHEQQLGQPEDHAHTASMPSAGLGMMAVMADTELLFSYGTLRQPEVQLATFGRLLEGRPDAIVGYDLDYVTITDPHVIATSGSDRHPVLKPGAATAAVEGTVFSISEAELAAADAYEVDDYVRVAVPLRSGQTAWVYVFAGQD